MEAADEAPAAAELAERQDELVVALAERQVDGVVLRVDDAEEARVPEALRAAAAPQDPAVQEDADVVAVPDLQLLHLVAVGGNRRPRVDDLHPGLGLEPLREVALKRNLRVRGLEVAIQHDEARRLRLDVAPRDRADLAGVERLLEVAR